MRLRLCFVAVMSVLSASLSAVDTVGVVRNWWSVGAGKLSVADTYLSNQRYSGVVVDLHAVHQGWYRGTDRRVSWQVYDYWYYAPMLMNVSYSAYLQYAGVDIGYGSHYVWRPVGALVLSAGGVVDIHGAVRYHNRNVNNMASGDVEIQLLASAGAGWSYDWRKNRLTVDYSLSVPVIGTMFVPEMGQSYYELYLMLPKGLSDVVHFSSFHNRQGVRGKFRVELKFGTGTLFIAMNHDYRQWHANGISVVSNSLSGQIGFALNLKPLE